MAAVAVAGGTVQPDRAPGYLRLYGRESLGSLFRQSLVARRQQAHCYSAATAIEFEPEHFQQMAGLICYYNSAKFHYLYVSHDETLGKHLRVMSCLPDLVQPDAFTRADRRSRAAPVELRVEVDYERLLFRLPHRRGGLALAARSSSTPASFPTKPAPPGLSELHRRVCRRSAARIWRERAIRPTSTISSMRAVNMPSTGRVPLRRFEPSRLPSSS